jgi:hypothetical protein
MKTKNEVDATHIEVTSSSDEEDEQNQHSKDEKDVVDRKVNCEKDLMNNLLVKQTTFGKSVMATHAKRSLKNYGTPSFFVTIAPGDCMSHHVAWRCLEHSPFIQ